jgi:hypothetical protein
MKPDLGIQKSEVRQDSGRRTQSVLECSGKQSAAPLSIAYATGSKRCRRSALPTHSKTWQFVLAAFCLLHSALCPLAHAQSYAIDWFTIDGGGGTSTGGVYSLSGTIGQPDAGPALTGRPYTLQGGFWPAAVAIQEPGAPTLVIVPTAPGLATVSWAPATPGFVLQVSDTLTPAVWVNTPSGAANPVTVPSTLPIRFYRLIKP